MVVTFREPQNPLRRAEERKQRGILWYISDRLHRGACGKLPTLFGLVSLAPLRQMQFQNSEHFNHLELCVIRDDEVACELRGEIVREAL